NVDNKDSDNDLMLLDDKLEPSAAFELDKTLLGNPGEQSNLLSPSIQKRTVAIRNRKRSVSRRQ
ncbi:110_t:CDS:1, partial [Scutellospora calospora]